MEMNYEKQKRAVYIGLAILAVVTIVEVLLSLLGKGHLVHGLDENRWAVRITAILIIVLSMYKAKFIIFEFMHMAHEVPSLVRTVLLPTLLLVWAIIAFMWEGNYWKNAREKVKKDKTEMVKEEPPVPEGNIIHLNEMKLQ